MSEAYRTARDMSVQLDDPNAYKLLMKKSEFEQMCDKFYTSGFKDDAVAREAARDAMSYYVDQVQIRNADVMAYNVALSTIRDLSSRKSELDLKISEKDLSLARVAEPGLAVYAAFVGDAYEQAKESLPVGSLPSRARLRAPVASTLRPLQTSTRGTASVGGGSYRDLELPRRHSRQAQGWRKGNCQSTTVF